MRFLGRGPTPGARAALYERFQEFGEAEAVEFARRALLLPGGKERLTAAALAEDEAGLFWCVQSPGGRDQMIPLAASEEDTADVHISAQVYLPAVQAALERLPRRLWRLYVGPRRPNPHWPARRLDVREDLSVRLDEGGGRSSVRGAHGGADRGHRKHCACESEQPR